MSTEQNELQKLGVPAEIVGKFNIAAIQNGFQNLQNKVDNIVYTEDNLQEIAALLKEARGVDKGFDEAHKDGKAEVLKIGKWWDASKNFFKGNLQLIMEKPQKEYARMCNDIEDRRIAAAKEKQRKDDIQQGIENNAINFANQIASATTSVRLSEIERLINLEKGRKEKYQEFLEQASERFTQLNGLLASQKVTVKGLEEIKKQEEEAAKQQNEELMIKLQQQREEAEAKVEEQKIQVQEKVIEQSVNTQVQVAEEILPTVKVRRSIWKWEVVDTKEMAKKMPDWATITPVESKIDEYLKAKKVEGISGEEFTTAGVRFFLEKTY